MRISDLDETDSFHDTIYGQVRSNAIGKIAGLSCTISNQTLSCALNTLESTEANNLYLENRRLYKATETHSFDDISNDIVNGQCGDALEKTIENAKEKTDQLFNQAQQKGVDYIDNTGSTYPGPPPRSLNL
jgi:hypothetical protein